MISAMVLRGAAGLFCLVASTLSLRAETRWIELKTPHFDLETTLSEAQGKEALVRFEQVRQFFLGTSPFPRSLDATVRIVVFSSPDQYEPYRLNNASSAYFSHREDQDYIVLQDLAPEHYRAAVHEYTHLAISRSGVHLPLWMNEGWADLNSTLKPKGKKAMIGDMLAGRRDTLLRGQWIPLETLDKIDQRSPMYNERDQAGVFYAESWALMHMLFLAPEYTPHFNAFVKSMGSGKSLADSCRSILGKPVGDVQADIQDYLRRNKLYGAVFDINLTSSEETPSIRELSAFDSQILLADLLVLTRRNVEAIAAYQALAKQYPARPEIEAGWGNAALQAGNRADALQHYGEALKNGTTDPAVCYRLAMLSRETSSDRTITIQALRRALALRNDYTEARLQLGIALLDTKDYAGSLQELKRIPRITEDIAGWYFAAAAFDNAKLGNLEQARKDAQSGKKWARTEPERDQIERILKSLGTPKPL